MVEVLNHYKSKCNTAELIKADSGIMVRKTHQQEDAFLCEYTVYQKLHGKQLPCAEILSTDGLAIYMTHLPGKNLVSVLEDQEATGAWNPAVWEQMVDWLVRFRNITGVTMTDVNLRNFLYDENTQTVYGLDFEDCRDENLLFSAGRLAAYIRTYTPEYTHIKQEIAHFVLQRFSNHLDIELHVLLQEAERQEALLLMRRKSRT